MINKIICVLLFLALPLFAKIEITQSGRVIKDTRDLGVVTDALVNNAVSLEEIEEYIRSAPNSPLKELVKKGVTDSVVKRKQLAEITVINAELHQELFKLGKETAKKIALVNAEILAEHIEKNGKPVVKEINPQMTKIISDLEKEKNNILESDLLRRQTEQYKKQVEENEKFNKDKNLIENEYLVAYNLALKERDENLVKISKTASAAKNTELSIHRKFKQDINSKLDLDQQTIIQQTAKKMAEHEATHITSIKEENKKIEAINNEINIKRAAILDNIYKIETDSAKEIRDLSVAMFAIKPRPPQLGENFSKLSIAINTEKNKKLEEIQNTLKSDALTLKKYKQTIPGGVPEERKKIDDSGKKTMESLYIPYQTVMAKQEKIYQDKIHEIDKNATIEREKTEALFNNRFKEITSNQETAKVKLGYTVQTRYSAKRVALTPISQEILDKVKQIDADIAGQTLIIDLEKKRIAADNITEQSKLMNALTPMLNARKEEIMSEAGLIKQKLEADTAKKTAAVYSN
jgi:hypothetical protein